MRQMLFGVLLLLGIVASLSCIDESPVETVAPVSYESDPVASPAENEEAEAVAAVLSHELLAPQKVYDRIRSDLTAIREQLADSVPAVMIKYQPIMTLGYFSAKISRYVMEDSASQGRRRLDSLNLAFGLDSMCSIDPDWYSLYFGKRYNPVPLMTYYSRVTGMLRLQLEWAMDVVFESNLAVSRSNDDFRYFFQEVFVSGSSLHQNDYYVLSESGVISYQGVDSSQNSTVASWWDLMVQAQDTMWYID